MATVIEVGTDRPAEAAYAYVTDPTRFGEWQQDVVEARRRDATHFETVRAVGPTGRRTRTVYGIETEDPPRRWVARALTGPVRSVITVDVAAPSGGGRTRVTVTVAYEGRGIGRLLVPLVVRRQSDKQAPGNAEALSGALRT